MLFVCLGDIIGTDIQLLECVNWDFGDPPPPGVAGIPTLSEWGLIAMAEILGLVGFIVLRRRLATQS